jgi:hypothetical protein
MGQGGLYNPLFLTLGAARREETQRERGEGETERERDGRKGGYREREKPTTDAYL